jgi:hypothetical protein
MVSSFSILLLWLFVIENIEKSDFVTNFIMVNHFQQCLNAVVSEIKLCHSEFEYLFDNMLLLLISDIC